MLINSIKDVVEILGYNTEKDLLLADKTQLIENSQLSTISTANSTTACTVAKIEDNLTTKKKHRRKLVSEGIDTFLSLFIAVRQQRLFPRPIMTKHTKGQILVRSKEEIMCYFEACNYEDCRINAYPVFIKSEEQDCKNGINPDLFAPTILFIDLDAKRFSSDMQLQRALKQILKNIVYLLHDCKPLALWSGHGYHIIIPVNALERYSI